MYTSFKAAQIPSQVSLMILETVTLPILKVNDYVACESPAARYRRHKHRCSLAEIAILDLQHCLVIYGATRLSRCSNLSGVILINLQMIKKINK